MLAFLAWESGLLQQAFGEHLDWYPNREETYSDDGRQDEGNVREMNADGISRNDEILSAAELDEAVFLL